MDSITHLALGACTGEIILGKKLGKKALLYGALVANLPDIDTIAALFFSPAKGYLIHRGITHSLFFAIVAGICMALVAKRIYRNRLIPVTLWTFFFAFELALHDLLDTCTSYGTGLLEPFSRHRFSLHLIYVADPLFTISLLIAALFLLFKRSANPNRKKWAWAALSVSAVYLCFAVISKTYVNNKVFASLKNKGIGADHYFSTPAPFNTMLWYVMADADSGYYTTYSSVWDNAERPINYGFHPKNYQLIKNDLDTSALNNLTEFAAHYYTITQTGNTRYINILRFGQIQGWRNPNKPFAYSYPLNGQGDGMEIQKGRLKGWDWNSIKGYLRRIGGKQ